MKVTVVRAFLIAGIRQEPGATLDLPDPLAKEMLALNKAVPVLGVPDAEVVGDPAAAPAKPARHRARKETTQ